MNKYFIVSLFFLFTFVLTGRSQGLLFNSNDQLISERTSYNVFAQNQPTFGNQFRISFDISIIKPNFFGYILTIKDKNESISYSLTYVEKEDDSGVLKLNADGIKNLLSIPLSKKIIGNKKWLKITLDFNAITKTIKLQVNKQEYLSSENLFNSEIIPQIHFGKYENIIDVPAMAIRNLLFEDSNNTYAFQLTENSGNDVFDITGKHYGKVSNPNWLITKSYHWKLRYATSSKQVTSLTFDEAHEQFIFQNADSINFYNFSTENNKVHGFKNKSPISMYLGNSFLDSIHNKLYVYELNSSSKNMSSIASLDLAAPYLWESKSKLKHSHQRHHHNSFLDYKSNRFIIFGGIEGKRLSNEFHAYDMHKDHWNLLSFTGDTITPRYFAGLVKITENDLLLFGGISNKTGEKSIGLYHVYDCYKVNFSNKTIKKLWELKGENRKMVSSKNMLISKDSTAFYTLSYPEYLSKTYMQLYKYSIENGSYEVLGDSISFSSERIRTNTNLYFNRNTNELFCTIQEFELDGSNRSKIYSINAPPVSRDIISGYRPTTNTKSKLILPIVFTVLLTSVVLAIFLRKRKSKQVIIKKQTSSLQKYISSPYLPISNNSVTLFGDFSVFDNTGKDITYLFSTKLKQLFLLILLHSQSKKNKGVSSKEIYKAIWPDSDAQKVKNLKNVTLNKLRKITEDIEGIAIIHDQGRYFIEFRAPFYCDYFKFTYLLETLKEGSIEGHSLLELKQIISNGSFLKSTDEEAFDLFKKEFEYKISSVVPPQLKSLYKKEDYASIIPLVEILFNVDPINELAMYYKIHAFTKLKMVDKAKGSYNSFILKYKKIMGEDYTSTYKEVIKQIPNQL